MLWSIVIPISGTTTQEWRKRSALCSKSMSLVLLECASRFTQHLNTQTQQTQHQLESRVKPEPLPCGQSFESRCSLAWSIQTVQHAYSYGLLLKGLKMKLIPRWLHIVICRIQCTWRCTHWKMLLPWLRSRVKPHSSPKSSEITWVTSTRMWVKLFMLERLNWMQRCSCLFGCMGQFDTIRAGLKDSAFKWTYPWAPEQGSLKF